MASEDVRRRLYLIQELDVSILAIEAGLTELQESRPYCPRHFVFLLLLSTGIERLSKVVLRLRALATAGAPLSKEEMQPGKGFGHDLVKLCDAVAAKCFTSEYLTRPYAEQDLQFIQQDPAWRAMLTVLFDFAKADRYVYMNGISDPGVAAEWPERRWDELEAGTMQPGEYARLYAAGKEQEAKGRANRTLVACLERYVRALARLFVSGMLGDQARQVSSMVSRYYRLEDAQLGKPRRTSHP